MRVGLLRSGVNQSLRYLQAPLMWVWLSYAHRHKHLVVAKSTKAFCHCHRVRFSRHPQNEDRESQDL